MAKKKKHTADDNIDWYLISIDRLKQIGLVIVLLLLGGAGYWFWSNQKGNPKVAAESAIADARESLNALAASEQYNARRAEFGRAQQKLEEANAHLTASKFVEARDSAVESQTISTAALSGSAEQENDAQFLTVEGDVKYQKGSAGEWRDADPRGPLSNGDWVKTGDRASAELIFSNGSLYTVGPNALLEIYAAVNPSTSQKTNAVQMRVGSVEVATPRENTSTVRTPGAQVIVEAESQTQVDVDNSKETAVMTKKGAASVASPSGGQAVRVAEGEKVTASEAGTMSPVKKLAPAPALLSPADNQIYQLSPELKVAFMWDAQPSANGYVLQVSRSRLFATLEINARRSKPGASAQVTSEGAFYWRVASVGPDGDVGPFSTIRRFRVTGGGKNISDGDRVAPVLTLKAPRHLGGQFYMVEGQTESGATVFINNEEVDVEGDGTFQKIVSFDKIGQNDIVVKAVDAAGNQRVQSQTVIVQD